MAPELYLSSGYDSKVDIWALGISLLQLATTSNLTVTFLILLITEQRAHSEHLIP
jgi:serine/threonine protein kinase